MVDVSEKSLLDDNKLFYVGASRARLELSILMDLTDEECVGIIKSFGSIVKKNNPKTTLAKILGCKIVG